MSHPMFFGRESQSKPAAANIAAVFSLALLTAGAGCHDELAGAQDTAGPLGADASYFLGSGHFMQGAVSADTYFIGLSFNGLAALDRATWEVKTFPDSQCARIAVTSSAIYCTHHKEELRVLAWSAADHRVTGQTILGAPPGSSLEAMAVWNNRLYIAARRGGILRTELDGSTMKSLPLPMEVGEPWGLAPLGTDKLVVAAGRSGLHVLDFSADPEQPRLLGSVPLAGLAIAVSLDGTMAYVAALSGGGHAIDLSDPSKPVRSATLADGSLVYDFRSIGGAVIASAGYQQITAKWIEGKLQVVGVQGSKSWAMGAIDSGDGSTVYSAEFSVAGRYKLDTSYGPGPYLRLPVGATAAARGTLAASVPIQNIGSAPLVVDGVKLVVNQSGTVHQTLPGFTVPPGGAHFVDLSLDAEDYALIVDSSANLASQRSYQLRHRKGLQPGDALPGPLAYQQIDRTGHDILAEFAGKVGFLMIGASSCPVAYYALNAARADLKGYLADKEVVAFSLDPWDSQLTGEMVGLDEVFPHLLSPLTTMDSHDHSDVMDRLGQEGFTGPPMPIVYVVGRDGKIKFGQWGYEPILVQRALAAALSERP